MSIRLTEELRRKLRARAQAQHRKRSDQARRHIVLAMIAEDNPDAYNLGNLWRRLALPNRIDTWSLVSLLGSAGLEPCHGM